MSWKKIRRDDGKINSGNRKESIGKKKELSVKIMDMVREKDSIVIQANSIQIHCSY
jgi:hypothetical protein